MSDRLPFHSRALDLFRAGYDIDSARLIASGEHLRVVASPELQQPRPPSPIPQPPAGPTATLPIRMVGYDRGHI